MAAAGFIVLAGFQLALTLGASWGEAAYGGTRTDLPMALRLVSGVATFIYVFAALVVLRRGGYRVPLVGDRVARIGTWVLVALMTLGASANFASSGDWERFGWGPFTLVLAALCFMLARTATESGSEDRVSAVAVDKTDRNGNRVPR